MKIEKYNKPILFYTLSIAIPWVLWFLAAYVSHLSLAGNTHTNLASAIAFLGLLAPVAVTFFLVYRKKELRKDLLGRFFNFKGVKIKYLLLTCFVMLASILLAQLISLFFGYRASQFHLAESFSFSSGVFPIWFMLLAAPVLEELAWHSYGTDCLRSRFNLFNTSLIFGLFWGIWHFPLSFIKDYYQSNLIESGWIYSLNFIFSLIPFVLIMNWLYYKANRNILVPMVFHITACYFNEIFATHPMSKVIQTGVLLVLSVFLVLKEKEFFFKGPETSFEKEDKMELTQKRSNLNRALKRTLQILLFACFISPAYGQSITQTVRGRVYDQITEEALPFSTIAIITAEPVFGTMADIDGIFVFEKVPVGRQSIQINMLGYESYLLSEIIVSAGQEVVLDIGLQQSVSELDEIVVRVSKEVPLNTMTTVSARQFTVEEMQRYAGGMDDPARLVSSFAGVATPSVSSNGISVRGNNPDGLLWRIEGVEVPSPNHFANLSVAGGGLLTTISNQMMSTSDFYTGAFPAEYGNASSGVFDIKLRTGNSSKRQYTFQAGVIGVDFATQGPFVNGKEASYIMNYRYSTMALVAPILPDDAGILKYQDFSFKTNFPTKDAGIFTLWGIGALDGQEMEAADPIDWESDFDRDNSQTSLYMFASGLSHRIRINSNTFIKTTLSASGNGLSHHEQRVDMNMQENPQSQAENNSCRYTVQSLVNKRFGNKHSNRTGFSYSSLAYNIDVEQSMTAGSAPVPIANQEGNTGLLQIFTQSKINLLPQLTLNLGVNTQYFTLNKNYSIEPRAGLKYNFNKKHNLAFAYGLHSRIEQLPVYFVEQAGNFPNKNLDLMKSAHYVLAYHVKLSNNLRMSIEPYYQHLTNVPVAPDSYVSIINNDNNLFFNESLVSQGEGRNIGVDLSLERFLGDGIYYLLTASVFDSKYSAVDGIERNTRYNKNYVFNVIAGKEWEIGRSNILGANIRLNYLGGNRKEAIDEQSSLENKGIVYGETNGILSFEDKLADVPVVSFTILYRRNRPKYSSVWSLQVLNVTGTQEYSGAYYNIQTGEIGSRYDGIMIPNLSYKIEF